jgi:hypothetical protein
VSFHYSREDLARPSGELDETTFRDVDVALVYCAVIDGLSGRPVVGVLG